ncbi:MAG: DUF1934 domain-containing protein [Ruminococcaceae bacterium]|nr:DUF1934 domain-containing protein [Oscillospiraceae bacterium]
MSIPIKLTISTKHTLPTNHNVSMYDRFRSEAMEAVEEVMEEMAEIPYPAEESAFAAQDESVMDIPTDALVPEEEDFDPEDPESREAIRRRLEALIDECFSQAENSENTGRYIFTTEAVMEVTPGSITITYEEAPGSDLGETKSTIRIDRANPHSLSIERSGTLMNTLICEKGRRHTSVYFSPMIPAPLEACTYTRRCDVDLDEEGGVIFLDYIIEIRGADVQRTTIRMNIIPLEN